jgi:FAD/FMN-containing dehydrogenase
VIFDPPPAGEPADFPARPPDRRRFLVTAGTLGAAVGAGALLPGCMAGPADPGPTRATGGPTVKDWEALRRTLSSHHLARPGEHGYDRARELFDPRFDRLRPAGIAYCRRPDDVAACVDFASKFRLPIRARSGGHSYAGWSSVNHGLVADVSELNSFAVGNGTVRVGSGLALINFYSHLAARGLAVPGGSCPTVGIAGLALGGGVGVLARKYGLTSDNLESVQLVTAAGDTLTCDSGRHSDLFWACRGGGGGNFGVATAFTFRTHRLPHLILFFLGWPWSQAARVVGAWQSWAPHAPDELWSNMHLSAAPGGGTPQIQVGGTYTGSISGVARLLDELYAKVGSKPSSYFLNRESYLNAMLVEAGCSDLSVHQCHTGPIGVLPRVPSFAKSDFFTRRLDKSGIRVLLAGVERLVSVRGAAGGAGGIAFDAMGGAVNRVHPAATAFVHRNALFLAQYTTEWRYPGSHRGVANQHVWLRSYYRALHPHASGQAYQNYIDPELTDWRRAYYGANYPRLTQVKATYDPDNLFNFPQSIPPA